MGTQEILGKRKQGGDTTLGIIVMMDITTSMRWCTWSNYLGEIEGKRENAEQKQLKHSVNVEVNCFSQRQEDK